MTKSTLLSGRREFLFLYDIKMGNPNGDPDENRPRILPDGTHYVTDVRLKRFVRDFLKMKGQTILVDDIEGKTVNLTGRVVHYLQSKDKLSVDGQELVEVLLDAFIDARLFGSSFAFKEGKYQDKDGHDQTFKRATVPKTMTGAVQINMGEVLHRAEEVDILGTSVFSSSEDKTQGTFTNYYGLRYALIGFSGIGNEHSAAISRMTNQDYETLLTALWHGVRSAGNTRTKTGQIPRLLLSLEYQPGEEFQVGRLHDYVQLLPAEGKEEKAWDSPKDYRLDLSRLITWLEKHHRRIEQIRYEISPDMNVTHEIPASWTCLNAEDRTI